MSVRIAPRAELALECVLTDLGCDGIATKRARMARFATRPDAATQFTRLPHKARVHHTLPTSPLASGGFVSW
jgi:hypothetical protein